MGIGASPSIIFMMSRTINLGGIVLLGSMHAHACIVASVGERKYVGKC